MQCPFDIKFRCCISGTKVFFYVFIMISEVTHKFIIAFIFNSHLPFNIRGVKAHFLDRFRKP